MNYLKSAFRWVWPSDTIKFYESYFRASDLEYDTAGASQHWQLILKVKVIMAILLLKSTHLLYLALVPMSDVGHLIHYNVFHFLTPGISVPVNVAIATYGFVSILYYYIFYFQVNDSTNSLVRSIIIHEKTSFFLCSALENEQFIFIIKLFAAKLLKYLKYLLLFGGSFALYGSSPNYLLAFL